MCVALIRPQMYGYVSDHNKEISDFMYYNVAFMHKEHPLRHFTHNNKLFIDALHSVSQ